MALTSSITATLERLMSFKLLSPASVVVLIAFVFGTFWGLKINSDRSRTAFLEKQKTAVRVLTYRNLFSPELKRELEKDGAFVVDYIEVDTAEELWEKLEKPGANGPPDVITLFSYQVPLAAQLGWLQAIARPRVPNLAFISPDFLDIPGDPSLHQVAPLLWGVSGLVQKAEAGLSRPSWREAVQNPKLKGKIALPNSTAELLRLALSPTSAGIPVAANSLPKILQPWVTSVVFSNQLLSAASLAKEAKVVMASNGEMAFTPYKNSDWKFSLPDEKATLWILSLALAREPRDEQKAYAFLNAALGATAALELVETFHQASTHRDLEKLKALDPRLKPSYLRQIPFESFVLWTDSSRAREVRALMAGQETPAPEPEMKATAKKKVQKSSTKAAPTTRPETPPETQPTMPAGSDPRDGDGLSSDAG
jgi:spermidine/putrescine transport system substrate-binding protein